MSDASTPTSQDGAGLPATVPTAPPPAVARPPAPGVNPALTAGLTAPEKAAIVIAALGPEEAAKFLETIGERHIRKFARAISQMRKVPAETVNAVAAEFLGTLFGESELRGGHGEARKFLGRVLDEDSVARIMDNLEGSGRSLWEKLGDTTDAALAAFLQTEHPQLASVVLAKLRSDKSARVLERLDPVFAREIVLRMTRVATVDPDAMEHVRLVMERDFVSVIQRQQASRKPADLIAGVMNHISANVRDGFLDHLTAENGRLAGEVQRLMFTFRDIPSRVEARDISIVLRGVEEEVLNTALKIAMAEDDPTAEYILSNISKRLSERLVEDIETMPPVRPKDGEAAQAEVVAAIQRMSKSGELKLIELDSNED